MLFSPSALKSLFIHVFPQAVKHLFALGMQWWTKKTFSLHLLWLTLQSNAEKQELNNFLQIHMCVRTVIFWKFQEPYINWGKGGSGKLAQTWRWVGEKWEGEHFRLIVLGLNNLFYWMPCKGHLSNYHEHDKMKIKIKFFISPSIILVAIISKVVIFYI